MSESESDHCTTHSPDPTNTTQSTQLELHTPPSITTIRSQTWKNAPRRPTLEPKGVYEIHSIDEYTWAPNSPDKARKKFRSVCGYVGRARININVEDFRKVDPAHLDMIITEIMSHFTAPDEFIRRLESCALGKAKDAWRNWKHVLY